MRLSITGTFCYREAPWLYWSELFHGLELGYLKQRDVVEFALEKLTVNSSADHYSLASLDESEYYEVSDLICSLTKDEDDAGDAEKVWKYLLLLWLWKQKDSLLDPLGAVEELYADLGYPEDLSKLVRYMPPTNGSPGSKKRLMEYWNSLLEVYGVELQRSHIAS
ncbi:DUF2247 family protein (plasmid) [Rhizobium sp. CB3171]|uniref:DUF2247 family protein n=1 Tax=Rhizobium sp. CB3171 TaxID=3039157 RepID=UPI0024B053D7|nr:DUF2247 family protein [Rhizobium sp. CB3171]WFU05759.1 DUF2247 family protein [Rhizobium sp. CB3171]